jgi:phenylalanyl-tRNA synthetase beta chain
VGEEKVDALMQVSLNWLKEYVAIELDPKELADLLTMSGSEIDSIAELGKEFEGVVVGQVTSVNPHPNADKLSLCTVETGSATCSIVCGAKNMKSGDKVPLALTGATLPSGITIKKAKIRGEASEGMLCSEVELALGNDGSGIMILSPDATVGQPLAETLGLKDVVFEIGLTPNRPDCLSLIGTAREISALTGKPMHLPSVSTEERGEDIATLTSVTIDDPDLCPRYCARIISGITIGPSPLWMRRRLEACGMRAINNVVDVTNYVLLEMGQPLHAFDLTLLDQQKIVVKRATPGSSFITLDDKEHKLPEDALMICDGSKPIALAGIMGGLNTEVKESTAMVLLESAYFTPTGILRTSKKMGVRTESSQRFEKGVDPEGVPRALNRAAQLIAELAGGTVNPGSIDNYPNPVPSPPAITLSTGRTNSILGTELKSDEIAQTLKDLSFTVNEESKEDITVTPPSFRVDVKESIDLVEEVARLRGYDKIPATLPRAISQPPKKDRAELLEKKTKETLVQHGYREIITYSFISPLDLQNLGLSSEDQRLKPLTLLNPLTEDQASMRTTLIPGLLSTARKNIFQNNSSLKLFEVGPVFFRQENAHLPEEVKIAAGLATGLYQEKSWNSDGRTVDFYDLKGCIETLLAQLRVRNLSFSPPEGSLFLHTGNALDIMVGKQKVGFVGEILPQTLDRFQLSQQIYVFEIFLFRLLPEFSEQEKFHPLPKYPPVYRDIALVIDDTIPAQTVSETMEKFKNKYIEEIEVFDYYKGKSLAPGKKSLAYRLKYQAYDHTLTDREVNALHDKLIDTLNKELDAVLRE